MTDDGMNPAEAAAEKILKEEFDKAQAESCPQGEDCAVHFRNSEEYVEEEYEYARMIDYVGDFVVVTDDSPEGNGALVVLRAALGLIDKMPPRWETCVYYVGEGAIGDLSRKGEQERRDALRYRELHNKWSELKTVHQSTVTALASGLIDVSKPVEG